ncbi:MAG: hypothetical protein COY81_00065 [Candidatus Pacebacteria bacterium CG_4_10_14_0_8_um_filter_43_12]|nr:MAG: hypothetical protein COU66_00395 [Candidatus Pacebacteria bacterium CG10_big_fil_rev_8_21_14_0_10_44_11]PIY79871.1 MAG: hypothetical protein COY81_00065 [Candidatus Pacebacteria bacterium CG_4_10_14_0_8_um_filter_43_12]
MAKTKTKGLTLTKATKFGRAFVKYGSIFLVVMIFGRIIWQASIAYWKATHPEPPPPPTRNFGQLPDIAFAANQNQVVSYKLELPTGNFPQFGDRAVVYFMPKKTASLLDTDVAKEIGRRYGFTSEPQLLNETTLRWNKSQTLNTTLELDIINHNFTFMTDYLAHPELILNAKIPTAFDAVQQVKQFLSSGQLLPADVATSSGKITYLRAVGGQLKPAVSVSDAQFVQVDLNRSPIKDAFPIYTSDGSTGTIHAILSSGLSSNGVVELTRNYWPVDYSLAETYYLRSVDAAWKLLQTGKGYVANSGTAEQAVIREVVLGYFEGEQAQLYLQPIYVFKGDGGFLGYVSALAANQTNPE